MARGTEALLEGGNGDALSAQWEGGAVVGGEIVGGIERLELCQRPLLDWALAIGGAVEAMVMHHNRDAIGADMHVALEQGLGPALGGLLIGIRGVLGPEPATTAMNAQRGRKHEGRFPHCRARFRARLLGERSACEGESADKQSAGKSSHVHFSLGRFIR